MPAGNLNAPEPQQKTLKLQVVHPFLSCIESETVRVMDKNGETEPKIDLSLTVETNETTSGVFEIDKTSVQFSHIFKLKSGAAGLIMAEEGQGLTVKALSQSNAILVSTPQSPIDYFPMAGQDALLVASDSGWSLEALGKCDSE